MDLSPAIGTTFDYRIPIDKMFEYIHEGGFDHVAIGMKLDHSSYHTAEGRKILKEMLDKWHLSIDSVHANYVDKDKGDIASLDENIRKKGVNDFCIMIDAAADLNGRILVFHAHGWKYDLEQNINGYIDSVLKSVEVMIARSVESGVKLAVENLYNKGSIRILQELFSRFTPDELGFCYDSSHDMICKETEFSEILKKYSSRLLTTHLSDNMGRKDDHMIPYTGAIEFDKVINDFPKTTYNGNILLEVEVRQHPGLADFTSEFLRQSFDAAMRIRKEIIEHN